MKKIYIIFAIAIILITVFVFMDFKFEEENTDFSTSCNDSAKKIIMGFSQIGSESEWRTASSRSITEAAQDADIELKFMDAQQRQENQIKAIRGFIAQRVDIIAFTPIIQTGWDSVLREARDADIPVILVDRTIDTEDSSLYDAYIGSDFLGEGKKAGKWLEDRLSGIDKEINIFEIEGTIGSAPAIERKEGFYSIIKDHKNMKIIKSIAADFMRSKGKEVMEDYLESQGLGIDVIYSHNDDMALGAIEALEEAGLRPGKDIVIISVDAVRGAFEAMIEGKLNCSVECNPLLGPQLMKLAKNIVMGKDVPKKTIVNEAIFTQENAKSELPNRKY